ncbi:chromosomal replication initiator DnaA [Rhizobium lentis]|uniref:Chromosomal replication initiator DnaA n=2 Tax=Rhizobium lentis TaxID=1138194 RepID=A0ABS7IC60_9HYPH|nr:chromosomal replication initiator DnaA [Rhizobium lentis]
MHQTELNKQHLSHAQVRARLLGKPSKPIPQPPSTVDQDAINISAIRALETQIAQLSRKLATATAINRTYTGMAERLKASEARVEKLELDLGDARARILSQAAMLKMPVDGDFPEARDHRRSVEAIVCDVLRDFPGVTWEDVKGIRRTRHLVEPRHACMRAVYEERKDLSLPALGRIFGGRDHTTILNAVRKRRPAQEG